MKKILVLFVLIVICFSLCSCQDDGSYQDDASDPCDLPSGMYYMVGDFEQPMIPYLYLDFDDHTFQSGAGIVVSYADYGSFTVKGTNIIATDQYNRIFVFEIADTNKLILVANGNSEYSDLPKTEKYEYVLYQEPAES